MLQAVLVAAGGLLTALAAVLAAWALIQQRRNEKRQALELARISQQSATKDEIQQAFDLQQVAMENLAKDNEGLRKRQGELHDTVNRLVGQLGVMTVNHRGCEEQLDRIAERLRIAEARIHELGG